MREIINLIRCLSIERRMRPCLVVMAELCANVGTSLRAVLKGSQVHTFIFQASPKSFNKHIIDPSSFSVHRNIDPVFFQHSGEITRCELRALICVEYVRHSIQSQSLLQGLNAKMRLHRSGQALGERFPAMPIHNERVVAVAETPACARWTSLVRQD